MILRKKLTSGEREQSGKIIAMNSYEHIVEMFNSVLEIKHFNPPSPPRPPLL